MTDLLVDRDGAVLRLAFNRPEALNALTADMLHRAASAAESCADDPAVRVLVLTGTGRAFSSGADLAGPAAAEPDGPSGQAAPADGLDAAHRLIRVLRAVPRPVVAAVNGLAAGVGCSIALAADLAVARESAYFLLAFANIGLMPDGGASALVPAAIGRARYARMAMLAERVPAPQAAQWGLISHVVPDDAFDREVQALVGTLAEGPTASYAQTKRVLNASALGHLDTALDQEYEGQLRLFGTADFVEGVTAFRQKRPPRFAGM